MGDRIRVGGARMGKRKIRPGCRVRWCGAWYRLVDGEMTLSEHERMSHDERAHCGRKPRYDGRMDGMVGLFYDYGPGHDPEKRHVWLHSIIGEPWPGPSCINGVFAWETFEREG